MLTIVDAASIATGSILRRIGKTDPAAINRGRCDEWANMMATLVGGEAFWLDHLFDEADYPAANLAHCVLKLDGRWYDSEHVDGVDDALLLAGIQRDQREPEVSC